LKSETDYEVAAAGELPPVEPWPAVFADEDEEALAWATRYQDFQCTECLSGPHRAERAVQAGLLRDVVGNPFGHGCSGLTITRGGITG